jgi:hypothetical protein
MSHNSQARVVLRLYLLLTIFAIGVLAYAPSIKKAFRVQANSIIFPASPNGHNVSQNTGELRGTVKDQQDARIPNAVITLNDNQDHSYSSQTDEQGNFHFASVIPGSYRLEVAAQGFAKHNQQVDLTSARRIALQITLQVVITERIDIQHTDARISIEPDDNLSAITLSGKELEALPDDPTELLRVLREMAGVTNSGSVYIDGFRDSRLPPKQAIQMIRINASPFAAEYSEPGRGRIEITTKPGLDRFHGEFSLNFNDESLNARNVFAPTRAPLQIRHYSGYLSGPIIPRRWDFLIYAGRWEYDQNSVINARVISPLTFQPEPFVTTVLTPSRSTNFSIRTNYLVSKNQTIVIGYSYLSDEALNQGLQGGFDLPERGFSSTTRNNTLRFSLTSLGNNRMVNQIRLQLRRLSIGEDSISKEPALLVLESFNAGGNQGSLFTNTLNNELQLSDNLSYVYKKHAFKMGFRAEAVALEKTNLANFNGTFIFGSDFERDASGLPIPGTTITSLEHYQRTVLGLPGYRPSQFSINRGDPFVGFTQWEFGWFLQDDWRITNRLVLSYGLRHEFQTHLDDKINFAPRFSLAWAPERNRKSVIRLGSGIFYDYLNTRITLDTITLDGEHQQHFVIQRPPFFPEIPPDFSIDSKKLQAKRIKGSLNATYSIISTLSYERQLPWKLFGSLGYTWERGVHLMRTRNINAPLLGITPPAPAEGPVLQFESTGLSTGHELKLSMRTDRYRNLSLFGNYVLSSRHSDSDGAYMSPASSYDLTTEFGRANSDQRHRAFVGGTVSARWGLQLSPYLFMASGRPFNITTGRDNNADTLFSDRPAIANPPDADAVITRFGSFNPNPRPGDQIIRRNFGSGPGQVTVNLNISKTFSLHTRTSVRKSQTAPPTGLESNLTQVDRDASAAGNRNATASEIRPIDLILNVNAENLFNHTNLASPNGVLTSPFFGISNRALPARRIELSLKFSF